MPHRREISREGPWLKLMPGFYIDPDHTLHVFALEMPHLTPAELQDAIRRALPDAEVVEEE